MSKNSSPKIGVIIVSYSSDDVVGQCLSSLLGSTYDNLAIVVCDNASLDATVDVVRQSALDAGLDLAEFNGSEMPSESAPGKLTLIHTGENLGYAGGVNVGLEYMMNSADIDYFWVLNPDSEVEPQTASSYADMIGKCGDFSLMSGRTLYFGEDGMIQTDGGLVNMWTGICSNANVGQNRRDTAMPDADGLDYLSGANLIASRKFVEQAGMMREGYFLYYEEVDWAFRRGTLPLLVCPDAVIYHHAGTAIGSGTTKRRPSAFSNYFNFRNRSWFILNFRPWAFPVAYVYSFLKITKLLSIGAWDEANGAWRGLNNLNPPKSVSDRISAGAHGLAFARREK